VNSEDRESKPSTWQPGGPSPNPGGQPAWVKRARDAMRDELYPAAQAHLLRVLTGRRPRDARLEDDAMYATVTVEDRTLAARLVMEYSIPKPKAQVGLKHEGKGDMVVVEVKTYAPEEKSNG